MHRDRRGWRNERENEKEKEMVQAERKSKRQKKRHPDTKRHSENSIRDVMISEKSKVQILH